MTYHLETLGDERFQQLAQALLAAKFPDIQCLPVGQPDGGRDAFLRQKQRAAKKGTVIFQVKFSRDPRNKTERDAIEALIQSEKEKVDRLKARGASAYYLITNISGTSHLDVGSIDRVNDALTNAFEIPAYCWWRDDIETRLHQYSNIKWSFPEIIKGSDILQMLVENSKRANQDARRQAIQSYLAAQHLAEQEVKFKQVELQNKLLDLFVDLPVGPSSAKISATSYMVPKFIGSTTEFQLEDISYDDMRFPHHRLQKFPDAAELLLNKSISSRLVLEGAPGQGKSTITQYVCQVNRIRLLDKNHEMSQLTSSHRYAPIRIPFRVDLRDYATWLTGRNPFAAEGQQLNVTNSSLESFIAAQVEHLSGGIKFDTSDLLSISKEGPIIVVLDGFDEVADISIRRKMVDEIDRGAARIIIHDRSAQIVVTSRPAAFANSPGFEHEDWRHLEIQSMTPQQIDIYSKKWMSARRLPLRERTEFAQLLKEKLEQPHMRDLARNPMQLTILLALIHTRGLSLPDKRTSLYDNYMELFFNRESEKSRVVREYRDLLIDIHRYLAWTLHVSSEGGSSSGSISNDKLKKLLSSYLETQGHETSLVDELFTGMVERVVALVSRVQGTFEFEVQPLREYFAARHLYETAPYSPPGRERSGTKPDRFDALARNFYWLNVLRFYCGCFSKGELSSLVDGIQQLTQTENFGRIEHPRILIFMLLNDWVFTQQPLSIRRLVEILFSKPGFRVFISCMQTANGSIISLPDRCGNQELLEASYNELKHLSHREDRQYLQQIIVRNESIESRVLRWRNEEPPIRLSAETWLSDGQTLEILHNISDNQCVELVQKYGLLALRELFRGRRYKALSCNNEILSRSIEFVLNAKYIPPSHLPRREPFTILEAVAAIASVFSYQTVFSTDTRSAFRNIIRSVEANPDFAQVSGTRSSDCLDVDYFQKSLRLVKQFGKSCDLDNNVWENSLQPWTLVADSMIAEFGPCAAASRFGMLASGIRNASDRGSWDDAAWSGSEGLCSRMRFARLQSGSSDWWLTQFEQPLSPKEEITLLSMAGLWLSPRAIIKISIRFAEKLEALSPERWKMVLENCRSILLASSRYGKSSMPKDVDEFYENISVRLAIIVSMRCRQKHQLEIFDQNLFKYRGDDRTSLGFITNVGLEVGANASVPWVPILELSELCRRHDVVVSASYHLSSMMPEHIANEILTNVALYPSSLVQVAQKVLSQAIGVAAIKVGDVAEQERWFAG